MLLLFYAFRCLTVRWRVLWVWRVRRIAWFLRLSFTFTIVALNVRIPSSSLVTVLIQLPRQLVLLVQVLLSAVVGLVGGSERNESVARKRGVTFRTCVTQKVGSEKNIYLVIETYERTWLLLSETAGLLVHVYDFKMCFVLKALQTCLAVNLRGLLFSRMLSKWLLGRRLADSKIVNLYFIHYVVLLRMLLHQKVAVRSVFRSHRSLKSRLHNHATQCSNSAFSRVRWVFEWFLMISRIS